MSASTDISADRSNKAKGRSVRPAERVPSTEQRVSTGSCLHCAQPLPAEAADDFCCRGCRSVHALLNAAGLTRYYTLRQSAGVPVPELYAETRDRKWLEPIEEALRCGTTTHVALDLQGLQCTACVWLMEELFRRAETPGRILVNPAIGRMELDVPATFPLRKYVEELEQFGYAVGPAHKTEATRSNDLLLRTGIVLALAGNTMMFSIPIYLGLREGPVYELMETLSYAFAALSVVIGGSVFFKSAWQAVRRGILHMDLPIALGIALTFAGASWSFFAGEGRASYFDTIATFTGLMLLGRFLQERVLERNRRAILASDGADGLFVRKVVGDRIVLARCSDIKAEDVLLVAPGDLVATEAKLMHESASFALSWITGEPIPRVFARGDHIPAGAFNAGSAAVRVTASVAFEDSTLVSLLSKRSAADEQRDPSAWTQRFSRLYVYGVLIAAALGFVGWWLMAGDIRRALEVTTAVLVITCPCALGIATPLCYELVQAGLRRAGLFVRTRDFLDRAKAVRKVVFDKTGTLTTGTLGLADEAPLLALTPTEQTILYNLVVRSAHPKSVALRRAIETHASTFRSDIDVEETPGAGLSAIVDGHKHRVGAPKWATPETQFDASIDLVYSVDGVPLAALATSERFRPDAVRDVHKLREAGYETYILSGDASAKVASFGASLSLDAAHAVGGKTPREKASWIASHDHGDTLFIGDGINDTLAAEAAFTSGTPAVDRPFMPARTDFFFVTPGLRPIRLALDASHALNRILRRNLVFALSYNVAAVALAWAGVMTPWMAAVLMPVSSLVVISTSSAALSKGSRLWRS